MAKSIKTIVIIGLILTNCLTIAYFSNNESSSDVTSVKGESVATIGDVSISRQDWLSELEDRYGKELLRELVNNKVIDQLAQKYDINVNEEEVAREVSYFLSIYGMSPTEAYEKDDWKQDMKRIIVLEEILTKDVEIPKEDIQKYFEGNKDLFSLPTTYHIAHIVVQTEEEAVRTIEELEGGSSFAVLAMERSMDEFTASQGGSLGYVTVEDGRFPPAYSDVMLDLETGEWSMPVKVEGGYSLVYLHDKLEGSTWEYDDVKEQIRRKLALEQMQSPISPAAFWDELGVEWYYGAPI